MIKKLIHQKGWVAVASVLLIGLGALLLYLSPRERGLEVRLDLWSTQLRVFLQPVGEAPTPLPLPTAAVTSLAHVVPVPSVTAALTQAPATALPTPTADVLPLPSPTPLSLEVNLDAPKFELEDWNNCGPDTLGMYMRYYGWKGTQFDISNQIKPLRADRNVNVDELAGYVRQNETWLKTEYRVGGTLDLLHRLLAAGFPVMIEETFRFDQPFWFQDDLWGGHYLLLTGYNDHTQAFTVQDSFKAANQLIDFRTLDSNWQAFNRVYLLVYRPEDEEKLKAILGPDWDADQNRKNALDTARKETQTMPGSPFAWFNLGTNLVYFEQYDQAALAYDRARDLKMPQRMLRYQFGPFLAYFHGGRTADLMALVDYALKVTPNSEEDLLWKGWGLYRQGHKNEALAAFSQALAARPGYPDALYAMDYVKKN
jgi:tetratricopeptide (TPR) repeat protein